MNLSLEKLKKYGFNEKALTEEDFYRICEAERITVLEMDVSKTFYMTVLKKKFIVVRKKAKGIRRTFEMFHELAHHFVHGDRDGSAAKAFFFGLLENKNEREADALAIIALLPLRSMGDFKFLDEHPNRFAKRLWRERQRIYFLYGI